MADTNALFDGDAPYAKRLGLLPREQNRECFEFQRDKF
jgi:hypothetical protein